MFEWLFGRRRVTPSRPQRSLEALLAAIETTLDTPTWSPAQARSLCESLDELSALDPSHLPALRPRMDRWFAEHPLEIQWGRSSDFAVVDPLGLTTEETIRSTERAELAPWATLLRTFALETNGANVFHHGCDAGDLLALLRDPNLPERIENLPLPSLVDETPAQIDALVGLLCSDERFDRLQHLSFLPGLTLTIQHFERLARAPWASSLRTLDLTEKMVDWSVDCEDDLHRALRTLGAYTSLTHLFLYNDLHTTADVEALLESPLPALTHLSLGTGLQEPAFLERLASTSSLPKLEELCLSGGPPRKSPAWDAITAAPFAVFLHGTRVTADYPKRTR